MTSAVPAAPTVLLRWLRNTDLAIAGIEADWPKAERIAAGIRHRIIASRSIAITRFGAVADGHTVSDHPVKSIPR